MAIRIRDPQTGREGTASPDALVAAVQGGAEVLDPVDIFDPQTQKIGRAAPGSLVAALQGGAVPVGSREHLAGTTSKLESFARGAGQGYSFDFLDEIQAADPKKLLASALAPDGNVLEDYRARRDEFRRDDKIAQEANPKTSFLGSLAGGIANAFTPGIGSVGILQNATSTLGGALKAGGVVGGLSALGASEADLTKGEFGQAAKDVVGGGLAGAAMGGGAHLLGRAASGIADKTKEALSEAFDPVRNRVAALGGKTKEFTDLVAAGAKGAYNKGADATTELARRGVFKGNPKGPEILSRLATEMDDAVVDMHRAMADVGDVSIGDWKQIFTGSVNDLPPLQNRLRTLLEQARPDEAPMLEQAIGDLADRARQTEGNLGKMWDLKKLLGQFAGAAYKKAPEEVTAAERAWMLANEHLDEVITNITDDVARQTGKTALSDANRRFAAAATWFKPLAKKLGAEGWQANVGGMRYRDWFAGSATAGVLMGLGVPPDVAMPLGVAGSASNALLRSTPGRLARARIGEQMSAMRNAAAQQQGKLPRTSQAIQGWLQQNLQSVTPMVPPQIALRLQTIATAAPEEASKEIRSLLGDATLRSMIMAFTQNLAPSKFQTEIDGHVFSPEDKELAAREYRKLGYDPVTEAQKVSQTNRTGKLDMAVMAPAPPDYGDIVNDFNSRIGEMGF